LFFYRGGVQLERMRQHAITFMPAKRGSHLTSAFVDVAVSM
jgi:hypothetical protein